MVKKLSASMQTRAARSQAHTGAHIHAETTGFSDKSQIAIPHASQADIAPRPQPRSHTSWFTTYAGFRPMFSKEIHEIRRTWKAFLLPIIVGFSALTAPFLARFMSRILTSLGGDAFASLQLGEATYVDSYMQWVKELNQVVIIAAILCTATTVTREIVNGSAHITLSRPISRGGFLTAKYVADACYLTLLVSAGTIVVGVLTSLMFTDTRIGPLVAATIVWLIGALFFLCVALCVSASLTSSAAATGGSLVIYLLCVIASSFPGIARWTPAGMLSLPSMIVSGSSSGKAGLSSTLTHSNNAGTLGAELSYSYVMPYIGISIFLSLLLFALALRIFQRREI